MQGHSAFIYRMSEYLLSTGDLYCMWRMLIHIHLISAAIRRTGMLMCSLLCQSAVPLHIDDTRLVQQPHTSTHTLHTARLYFGILPVRVGHVGLQQLIDPVCHCLLSKFLTNAVFHVLLGEMHKGANAVVRCDQL